MKRLSGKLSGRRGMTLTEALTAVLMIALLTAVVMTGSGAAAGVYRQSVFFSESQTVSGTVDTALSDVLRYATAVETDSEGNVDFYTSPAYGITDGQIRVGTDASDRGLLYLDGGAFLLSDISYSGLRVRDFTLKCDIPSGVFSGSYRLYEPDGDLTSGNCAFSFRAVNDLTVTP
jgi:hypothetical protein